MSLACHKTSFIRFFKNNLRKSLHCSIGNTIYNKKKKYIVLVNLVIHKLIYTFSTFDMRHWSSWKDLRLYMFWISSLRLWFWGIYASKVPFCYCKVVLIKNILIQLYHYKTKHFIVGKLINNIALLTNGLCLGSKMFKFYLPTHANIGIENWRVSVAKEIFSLFWKCLS